MSSRGRVRAVVGACVLGVITFAIPAFVAPVAAQKAQAKDAKKLDKVQLQEAQVMADAVDWAQAGRPQPSDVPVKLETIYFFKSANGQTYVPFTAVIDSSSFADPNASYFLRVVRKGAAPVAKKEEKRPDAAGNQVNDLESLRDLTDQEREKAKADKDKKPPLPPATYEDLEFPTLKAGAGQPAKLSRAFQVPAGDYEVYVAVKERNPADKKQRAKMTVYRQDLTVPGFDQATGFVTSSVILADNMDALAAPLKPDQQREQPYTIGLLQIVPKVGTTFAKTQELGVYFQIYNANLDSAKKPDVLIEWEFYQKQGSGEKKVFATEPTILNASTLPKEFDPAVHMLAGPSAWPLTSFPAGDYRLAVKVTDKLSGKTVTQSVNFSVA